MNTPMTDQSPFLKSGCLKQDQIVWKRVLPQAAPAFLLVTGSHAEMDLARSSRGSVSTTTDRARPRGTPRIVAAAILCLFMLPACLDPAVAKNCQTGLTGRIVKPEPRPDGFGAVQGLPPLPLAAQEYVISIDDGPHPVTTPALLEVLARYCVRATFFLVGRNAEARPELVGSIVAHGHTIGHHSYRHPDLGTLTQEGILAEIRHGAEAVTGALPEAQRATSRRLLRLPGSAKFPPTPPASLIKTLNAEGFVIAGYDLSAQDWRNAPPHESFQLLFRSMKDRGVIVLHDGQSNTIALLPMVLDELARRGAKIVHLTS
jgi:peptidoglycan/xylan/chitin deacetylase (PgdA/CDA1 family)